MLNKLDVVGNKYELFLDTSYYDYFCVRDKSIRTFGGGFHLDSYKEAKQLFDLLEKTK